MQEQSSRPRAARRGVTVVCFLLIVVGQGYLLRNFIASDPNALLRLPLLMEVIFGVIMLASCVICVVKYAGWTTRAGCFIAFVLVGLYILFNILFYPDIQAAYLTGMNVRYDSSAGAIVALKLIIALVGVTGGIPVSPTIDRFEYSRRLKEKAQVQRAEWAEAAAKGAKKDLDDTIAKLKKDLGDEEFAELLERLKSDDAPTPKNSVNEQCSENSAQDQADVGSAKEECPANGAQGQCPESCTNARCKCPKNDGSQCDEGSIRDKWRGWGCG